MAGNNLETALHPLLEQPVKASQSVSVKWGKFESSILRWEKIIGRPVPPPALVNTKGGNPHLNPVFTEWMMGLNEGWVTNCNLKRLDALKACGNGVVPQQAKLALTILKARFEVQ
jgi:DNA (cytosine-5)-methyltransferase 1